jgi:hypothetical protein
MGFKWLCLQKTEADLRPFGARFCVLQVVIQMNIVAELERLPRFHGIYAA